MSRIDFIETSAAEQRNLLCRWVERFLEEGKSVRVAVDSTLAAQHLDQVLWTFSEGSFVPHGILSADSPDISVQPVVIVVGETFLEGMDVLVCDCAVSLEFMSRHEQTALFVVRDDPEKLQESRLVWQRARDMGLKTRHIPYGSGVGAREPAQS